MSTLRIKSDHKLTKYVNNLYNIRNEIAKLAIGKEYHCGLAYIHRATVFFIDKVLKYQEEQERKNLDLPTDQIQTPKKKQKKEAVNDTVTPKVSTEPSNSSSTITPPTKVAKEETPKVATINDSLASRVLNKIGY